MGIIAVLFPLDAFLETFASNSDTRQRKIY